MKQSDLKLIKVKGLGSPNENIRAREVGINPYKTFYHYLTPFGKVVCIDSPLFSETIDNDKKADAGNPS